MFHVYVSVSVDIFKRQSLNNSNTKPFTKYCYHTARQTRVCHVLQKKMNDSTLSKL